MHEKQSKVIKQMENLNNINWQQLLVDCGAVHGTQGVSVKALPDYESIEISVRY